MIETVIHVGTQRVTLWHRTDGMFIGKREEVVAAAKPAPAKPEEK